MVQMEMDKSFETGNLFRTGALRPKDVWSGFELMAHLIRLVAGGILVALGSWAILVNYVMLYKSARARISKNKTRNYTLIPVVGSALVLLGIVVLPISFKAAYWAIIIVDPGSILTIVWLPWFIKGLRH